MTTDEKTITLGSSQPFLNNAGDTVTVRTATGEVSDYEVYEP